MMRPLFALALWLIASTGFCQSIKVDSFEAYLAKSAQIEQLSDAVAVILKESQGVKTGAYLQVESDKKWATPVYDGIDIAQTKAPGQWIMFAPAGKYRVLLAEFDPETGPRYTYHDVTIGKGTVPPTDPPPSGDFAALTKVAKETADKLADEITRDELAAAYALAVDSADGKSYDELRTAITRARFEVMNSRKGASRSVDWASWLKTVDAELSKVVTAGDAQAYAAAIRAIVKGLQ